MAVLSIPVQDRRTVLLRGNEAREGHARGLTIQLSQGQVASPSSQRGRLRHEGVPHSKLLWSFGEYGVSYAWPLLVSTIFLNTFLQR